MAKRNSDSQGEELPYGPSYSDIPAKCRASYLDWLSSGRSDNTFSPGYLFLFFYGLERRFLFDQSSDIEKREILEEVIRLKELYSTNRSVQRYLGEFIEIAKFVLELSETEEPIYERVGWDVPLSLRIAIGEMLAKEEPISAKWLVSWFIFHADSRTRTPATRCPEEFRSVFSNIFDERFPRGLKVRKPRKKLILKYLAASGEFDIELKPEVDGQPVLDISGLRKPIEIAQEIADEAMDNLEKFSRYLGRNPSGRNSLEALALLPWSLASNHVSDEVEKLKTWGNSIVSNGGLIPIVDLLEELEGSRSKKITKRQLLAAADTFARFGFGVAPDPRFALRAPKITEPVVVFHLKHPVEKLSDVSFAYRNNLIRLTLGSFIAHADGKIMDAEIEALNSLIESSNLDELETTRLRANLKWLMSVPPDMATLRRQLKNASPEQQKSFRETVVAIAHSDNMIQSEEVAGIEKIYKALGLEPKAVYSDLNTRAMADSPITVKYAEVSAPGETIPAEAVQSSGIAVLNAARIAEIQSDTDRVSAVLGGIFGASEEEADQPEPAPSTSVFDGLDIKHANLVQDLLAQEHWSEKSFTELAEHHNLMPAGALETVNEWSFEHFDDALLDEYKGYDVSPEIAKKLKEKLIQDAK